MIIKKHLLVWLLPLLFSQFQSVKAQEEAKKVQSDFGLEIEGEYRVFYNEASFEGQEDHFPSLAFTPEFNLDWNEGYDSFNFTGFFRLDRDTERTHWDIRELYYQKAIGSWELSVGFKKVYWGVAESNHLVDIINQTDLVESFDGEEKLGQPMVQLTWATDRIGNFDFFYLPYHRKRTLPGEKGRLRFPVVIYTDDVEYESDAEEWHQDFAFRWSQYFGAFDIGLSHFYGTGRDILFFFDPEGNFRAFYPIINQTGLDIQATHNAFLWKFETIYRTADAQNYFAMVGGLEYTFSNIDGNGLDIGLLGEYNYDDRDELALNSLQNDIFIGSRIAFNDPQDFAVLIGGLLDLEYSSRIFSIEASRRFGSTWKAELEARIFSNISEEELILSNFEQDSFIRFSVSKFF